jgi:hypothetical protein
MIRYIFWEDEPIRIKGAGQANPQVIGEALAKLTAQAEGELRPKAVVDAARDKRHVLHPHFEWDDSVAAENFRLDQARNLIRIVRVEDEDAKEGSTRAFVSINEGSTAYRPAADVKQSVNLQEALWRQAMKELDAFERRYAELADICKLVKQARDALGRKLQRKNETRAAA